MAELLALPRGEFPVVVLDIDRRDVEAEDASLTGERNLARDGHITDQEAVSNHIGAAWQLTALAAGKEAREIVEKAMDVIGDIVSD